MTIKLIECDGKKYVELNGEDLHSILPEEVCEAIDSYLDEHDEEHDLYTIGLNEQHRYQLLIEE